ncbi:Tex family protein [Vulgatibacter incomptus]|uniref:Transcription accessory protein (S1 RNA-binding domain) n=1 Tax=Vulgatibacter incomptus TaxID=1391653 RepID=A0A0K1PER2_9BACT|nr:Tex family protein [Vulgatibacter incomptus]AKU92023.1 Transcription accessory protein (S1 RNA-binding domain) [Vulgatibacter incomptus]
MNAYANEIARALALRAEQVDRVLALHEEGATVPFMARYRKEATGGLDEVQIQAILDAAGTRKELDDRRAAVRRSIEEQGKLTPELVAALARATTRAEVEDLYLPYRPKRRTRATIARERGLEPLADSIWKLEPGDPIATAGAFVDPGKGVPDPEAALAGARDICAERVAEDPELRGAARSLVAGKGELSSRMAPKMKGEKTRFDAYADHSEPVSKAPSHRVLAILRGEAEEVLKVRLALPDDEIVDRLRTKVVGRSTTPAARQLGQAVEDGWSRLMAPSVESEVRTQLKDRADLGAVEIFAENLRHLLLAAPAGGRRVLALDPGLRTGIKATMLDPTGKVLETSTLYSEAGASRRAEAARLLASLVSRHGPELVAVGNGTGSREAEAFVREALGAGRLPIVSVSEQGASIYSASATAREELPDLDVSLRGAVSIGRRLQDPLAELVKIEPKSIGVGQYQHDVDQGLLKKKLGEVVDSCVSAVGVDANTASPQLLEHVAGVGPTLARRIVAHRDEQGPYESRAALRKVKGLGPKAFEQAAGFLRVKGRNPLDDSGVHPERYGVVERMAKDLGVEVASLVGRSELVRRIDWRGYVGDGLGEPTLRDILAELEKPGRDPRGDFSAPAFRPGLHRLEDVREGMVLQGVVTNVTGFGAFVDVGVHQDGLVHVSQLSSRFVKDPAEVVKVGDELTVKVVSVDLERKRLGLSVKALQGGAPGSAGRP